jgi:hypothetical protein
VFVGVARFVLQIPGSRSLKDRRRVVKSFKDRVRARLPVTVAEVGNAELHQLATIGLAVISASSQRCSEILSAAASLARNSSGAILADVATEIVSFGEGGKGVRGGIENALDAGADAGWDPEAEESDDDR